MPRRQVKRGGRKFQPEKPLIYVFCEGESEQAYAKFLKEHFADVAVLKIPSKTGLFSKAKNDFDKEPKYRNYAEVTDEIWFFFDVEADDCGKWDERWKIIETLRGLREKPNVHVRLLMTTACIEYWLMLHYKMMIPTSLTTVEDKERMRHQLIEIVPNYQKGMKRRSVKSLRNILRLLSAAVGYWPRCWMMGSRAWMIRMNATAGCVSAEKLLRRYRKPSYFWRVSGNNALYMLQ